MPSSLFPWLPGSQVAKAVRPLLDQQFFCWGEDIKRGDGNLLRQFGFVRCRADEAKAGCSRYQLTCADGAQVILWGGSLLFQGSDGWGVFVTRAHFRPRLVAPDVSVADTWTTAEVPTLGLPQNEVEAARLRQLLAQAFGWIAAYETWVGQNTDPAWRREIIARWWKVRTPAPEVAAQWNALNQQATAT